MVKLVDLKLGVDPTGQAPNAGLIQQAFNECAAAGVPLEITPGRFKCEAEINYPEGLHLIGTGPAGGTPFTGGSYSWFHFPHWSRGIWSQGGTKPRRMEGMNFYRSQPALGPGWAPNPADFDLDIRSVPDMTVEDCNFANASRAVRVVGIDTYGGNGRIDLRRITGRPLITGIDATNIYDVSRWDGIHFHPGFWEAASQEVLDHTWNNATAHVFGRVDNPEFGSLFSYGYKYGAHFKQQPTNGNQPGGATYEFGCVSMQCDASGGILVDDSADGMKLHWNKLLVANSVSQFRPMVDVRGQNNRLMFNNLVGIRGLHSLVSVTGSGNRVQIVRSRSEELTPTQGMTEFHATEGNTIEIGFPHETVGGQPTYGGGGVIEAPTWQPM